MVSYLTTLFLGKSPEVNLPVHVLSAHFSPVTGSLLFLKQLIPNFRHLFSMRDQGFFGCLRGRCKAPVPMANTHIFSQFGPKNSQSDGNFM